MKASYPMTSVQPVVVTKLPGQEALISFVVPPESMYYAAGVSYEVKGRDLHVVIDRCPIQGDCRTMAKSSTKLGEGRTTEVKIPFDVDRIVMVHSDDVQQVYP